MQPLNRTQMAKRYRGQWVALHDDRQTVVASGKTVKQALIAAQKKGCANPVVTRMPQELKSFVGSHRRR